MDKKKMQGFYLALEHLLVLRRMPLQMITLFSYVAINAGDTKTEGVPMQKLAKALDISTSAVTRLVATLSENYRDASNEPQAGLNLLVSDDDPMDRRVKLVRLTAKGKKIAEQITSALR